MTYAYIMKTLIPELSLTKRLVPGLYAELFQDFYDSFNLENKKSPVIKEGMPSLIHVEIPVQQLIIEFDLRFLPSGKFKADQETVAVSLNVDGRKNRLTLNTIERYMDVLEGIGGFFDIDTVDEGLFSIGDAFEALIEEHASREFIRMVASSTIDWYI